MKRKNVFLMALLGSTFLMCLAATGTAQDQVPDAPVAKVEMLTMKVLVLDQDGNPLEGAKVTPRGLRTKQNRGSHWFWRDESFGAPARETTGTDGLVEIPIPKFVVEKMEVGEVTLNVSHSDFVNFDEDRSVSDDPAEVKLERGFRVALNAINAETSEKITTDLYAVISGYSAEPWKLYQNGMLVSPVYTKQKGQMRVMQIIDNVPVLFSERIEIEPTEASRILLKDVKLFPGFRLVGKLDDSVPRPIANGSISAQIARTGIGDVDNWNSRWNWSDKVEIAADGTFVFESLPPDEVVQLIAVCDGFLSESPTLEEVKVHFPNENGANGMRTPQLFRLSKELGEIVLVMEPTTSVRVKVQGPDETPLAGVQVYMCPNEYHFNSGSTILGMSYSSAEGLVLRRQNARLTTGFPDFKRFVRKTDESGVAVIDNLPIETSQSVAAVSDDYEMPVSGNDRSTSVDLKRGVVTEITIKLQKKGTEQLGAESPDGDKDKASDDTDDTQGNSRRL